MSLVSNRRQPKADRYVAYADGASLDAFGRLRVGEGRIIFDSALLYDEQPLLWDTSLVGSSTGAHNAATASYTLTVTTASGDVATRTTRAYSQYQPGQSLLMLATGVMGAAQAGVTRRIGRYDDSDGLFFEQSSSGIGVVVRTSTTGAVKDTRTEQANWTIDKLDGTGPSSVTLDLTKAQIFVIDLEWLGVGRVRYGVVVDGVLYYCHEINNANHVTDVYMSSASLPVRYEIKTTAATTGSATLKQICAAVVNEGGIDFDRGLPFSAGTGVTSVSLTSGAARPLLVLAPATTYGGRVNRGQIDFDGVELACGAGTVYWQLIRNATLTTGTYSAVDTYSHAKVSLDTTGYTGGRCVLSGYISGGAASAGRGVEQTDLTVRAPLTLNAAGTSGDTLTLVGQTLAGTVATNAVFTWHEIR